MLNLTKLAATSRRLQSRAGIVKTPASWLEIGRHTGCFAVFLNL